jgi:hypothetical protein
MRAIRPRTFHAGHAPSHLSCGPIMCPRTFHAGQSCALALFMRANHAPSHFSCRPCALAPLMRASRPRTFHVGHVPSHLTCGPIMRPRTFYVPTTSPRTFHAGQLRALGGARTFHAGQSMIMLHHTSSMSPLPNSRVSRYA